MRFHQSDDDYSFCVLSDILNTGCDPKLVASDIEDDMTQAFIMVQICGPECFADIRERSPSGGRRNIQPAHEGVLCLGASNPKALQYRFSNDPHVYIMYTPADMCKEKSHKYPCRKGTALRFAPSHASLPELVKKRQKGPETPRTGDSRRKIYITGRNSQIVESRRYLPTTRRKIYRTPFPRRVAAWSTEVFRKRNRRPQFSQVYSKSLPCCCFARWLCCLTCTTS